MRVSIGIIYEKVRLDAKRTNIKRLWEAINRLLKEHDDVKLVVLPSYPFVGPLSAYEPIKLKRVVWSNSERLVSSMGRSRHSSIISTMASWSLEYGVYIIGGPLIERAGPKLYLTVVSTSPSGEIVGKYRKISLSMLEEEAGISSGRSPGLMKFEDLGLTIGVFVEDDLAYPELFKAICIEGANIILGYMLPYNSPFFGNMKEMGRNNMTMDQETICSFLITRSKETGLPLIMVGGAVEVSSGGGKLYTIPLILVEPDIGILKDKIKSVDDIGSNTVIEVDSSLSKPRTLRRADEIALKLTCRALDRKGGKKSSRPHTHYKQPSPFEA